jgi:hypothetical protein
MLPSDAVHGITTIQSAEINVAAPQARGFRDVLRWKLSSRPEPSLEFILDVEQSTPPRRVESSQFTNHTSEPLDRGNSIA